MFYMEAAIVMDSSEEIIKALRDIADKIERGTERDWIPGEIQGAEWSIVDDDPDYYENNIDYYPGDEDEEYPDELIGF